MFLTLSHHGREEQSGDGEGSQRHSGQGLQARRSGVHSHWEKAREGEHVVRYEEEHGVSSNRMQPHQEPVQGCPIREWGELSKQGSLPAKIRF